MAPRLGQLPALFTLTTVGLGPFTPVRAGDWPGPRGQSHEPVPFRTTSFDSSYEKLTLNDARGARADGRDVSIETKDAHLRDAGTAYQVYDNEKPLILAFPNRESGDPGLVTLEGWAHWLAQRAN